ncbi:ETC complex I subunit [Ahrensia sp. 13_GOM-1096m]|uniref:ETC complex I subunit n=1 Tax=Ahrensia sp. 13_GOM-1096m TaxID=1380380 RepID=UPI000478DAD7|nr:ETC complex I subunit [Ahrensia sp. 13_GOM-1096m]
MTARIYSPAKTAMQSGKGKASEWLVEFDRSSAKSIDPLMGYTSSGDTQAQVKLRFTNKEEAVAYAQKQGLAYRVEEPKQQKRRNSTYSDNFKFDRKVPWTH